MTTSFQVSDPKPIQARGGLQALADLSLRIKLILAFSVVTLLAVSSISILNIRSTNAALSAQVGETLAGIAQSEAHKISAVLAERVSSMQSLALSEQVGAELEAQNAAYRGGTEDILAELAKLDEQWVAASDDDPLIQERLPGELAEEKETAVGELEEMTLIISSFAEAFVTDRYGGLVAASARTSDYYQADEGWWQAAYDEGRGAVYIGEPELDESTGVIGINMAVPVYGQNNEVVGILRTTLDATALIGRLADVELGETGEADLIFSGGKILEPTGATSSETLDASGLAQLSAAPHGYVEAIYGENPGLIGYAAIYSPQDEQYISALDWKVIVHQDRGEALAPVTAQTRSAGLLALLTAGIAIAVAVGMGQVLATPIVQLTGVVTRFTTGDMSARVDITSRDETGLLAASFNQMADQVSSLLTGLQARTRALETSAQVSRRLSTILDPQQLVAAVVEQVQAAFGYYHAHIYLIDEASGDPSTGSGQALVMAGGTGAAGREMLARGHKIPRGKGLVGRAAETKAMVLVPDVAQEEGWLPNPLLPDTKSEIAVPIIAGERVLGVLDVQHDVAGGLGESDSDLLQSVAGQVAIALQNTRLFAEAQRKAAHEARLNLITQRIQGATTVENALQIAVREVGQALGAAETSVRLGASTQPGNGRSIRVPVGHDEAKVGS
jgi:putative methionine-R-sulfoxide reductase with GAF domain